MGAIKEASVAEDLAKVKKEAKGAKVIKARKVKEARRACAPTNQ